MDKVEFLVRANDSIWTRDYGPWFIFDANGELGIVNHTYNRPWRPNDNYIPLYFGQEQRHARLQPQHVPHRRQLHDRRRADSARPPAWSTTRLPAKTA